MSLSFSDRFTTTLASGYTSGGGSLSLSSVSGLGISGACTFWLIVQAEGGNTEEVFKCTNVSGTTLTVVGAQSNTSASNHGAGAVVLASIMTKDAYTQLKSDSSSITVGAYSGRPMSAGSAGSLYICTDSPYRYFSDGSTLYAEVFGYVVTEPVLGNFTQVNVGHSTFDSTHGGIIQIVTNASGDNVQVLAQAIPGSGAYYVDCACMLRAGYSISNAGCGVSDGTLTSNKIATSAFGAESDINHLKTSLFNSTTSFNANRNATTPTHKSPLIWLRFYDDRTTNRTWYVSMDGYTWEQITQEGRTNFLTPAQAVLTANPVNADVTIHWVHFSIHT
jgi:hypothetical protein